MRSDGMHTGAELSRRDDAAGEVSRRQMLQRASVALGGIAGAGLVDPSSAFARASAAPRPIPGGFTLPDFTPVPSHPDVHFFLPGIGFEMSTITDFAGVVGGSET